MGTQHRRDDGDTLVYHVPHLVVVRPPSTSPPSAGEWQRIMLNEERPDCAARARIGTAGWSIPKSAADCFAVIGTHLQRYAALMPAVEINSSFHRPHGRATYERWRSLTPQNFEFSVKIPKEISHVRKLVDTGSALDAFIEQVGGLGSKLAVLLLQLPPRLEFDECCARKFLIDLRDRLPDDLGIACEPRHPSWFEDEAEGVLIEHCIARVAADPVRCPGGERLGGWPGLRYWRLHGSPRVYYSPYDEARLAALAEAIACEAPSGASSWCIFDNTASGAATSNAVELQSLMARGM